MSELVIGGGVGEGDKERTRGIKGIGGG